MATVTVPPDVSPWDAPLTPSYPPALSPGTKRATGRAETGGDSYADAPCPTIAGMWMLKRSEHLKRWNKRWVSLDAAGARLTFRASPGVAKALSHVAVEHIRGAFVSSVNFHGNKSYAGRCVCLERKHADPESDASREVFLVAATRADANEWVAKVRALVAERNPIDTDDAIRLSPVAAPPTPALVNERDPRRAPASASSSASAASASAASSSFSSDAGTPVLKNLELSNASRSAFEATSDTAANDADAPSARVASVASRSRTTPRADGAGDASLSSARWFDFTKSGTKTTFPSRRHLARSSAENSKLDAEELQATASATHAQMAHVREMAREAREAKDAELRATRESVAGARAAAAEARRRADVTQTRLEEKAAEAASLRRELEDVKAAAALAAELARARLARADALEHTLNARLAAAEARGDALAEARDAAEAAGTQAADALRADLHAAGVSALRAATEAEASLDAARRRVEALEREKLELERLRGWKGVFARGARKKTQKKTQTREGFSFSVENFENRNDAPLLADAPSSSEGFAARGEHHRASSSSAPRGYRGNGGGSARSGGGFVAAATAASAPADASTPEAAATARRRLFEYGLVAPPTPADILQTLDSPGAHGCRQM